MMRRLPRSAQDKGIDISPLIDMVFILLIFFMVSTTFVKDMNLDIDRPSAASAAPASTKAIRIFIDASGETFVDGQPVRPWVIQSRVRELLESGSSETVLVVTDEEVAARRLIEVVDQARLAGAADVGVATELEAGGTP
jgi:biopolymer transport protein ExbD